LPKRFGEKMRDTYAIYARVNYPRMYPQDSYRGGDVVLIRHNQYCTNCVDYQRFTQQISRVPSKASIFFRKSTDKQGGLRQSLPVVIRSKLGS